MIARESLPVFQNGLNDSVLVLIGQLAVKSKSFLCSDQITALIHIGSCLEIMAGTECRGVEGRS